MKRCPEGQRNLWHPECGAAPEGAQKRARPDVLLVQIRTGRSTEKKHGPLAGLQVQHPDVFSCPSTVSDLQRGGDFSPHQDFRGHLHAPANSAWVVFQDEAGQSMTPPRARTWGRQGSTRSSAFADVAQAASPQRG